ncbi:MAG: hypothetical protein D6681_16630 [Calditrichaeota bacterium]|nr:MAG: hypothetical protein D6681_16630 [Calditrichota bacterium]
MKIQLVLNHTSYTADLSAAIPISIPLKFDGEQPNHFGVPPATAEPVQAGDFLGDVRRGGSCNVESYRVIPHCNGTHTECVGHITEERVAIMEALRQPLVPATLITVEPVRGEETPESYAPPKAAEDILITRQALEAALASAEPAFLTAVIIRTRPNDPGKRSRNYLQEPPPYFSREAMAYLGDLPLRHLLVDIPSVDRVFDEGRMVNHRRFWGMPSGSRRLADAARPDRTITEMIYAPDEVADGRYLVNIQIPPFLADAAPARVWLFPISPASSERK